MRVSPSVAVRSMTLAPSRSVRAAFGIAGEPIALAGGERGAYRVGEVVLKWSQDTDEAGWIQALLSRIEPDGCRVARPVATIEGKWLHEGWSASPFVHGLRPAAPSWEEITDAGLRFADAADRVRQGGADVLSRRTHRWAIADRVAWEEQEVRLGARAAELHRRILTLRSGDATVEEHFVHGDLSGNVFFDPSGVPVVLDVSPYLRPRRWAAAIVIADAVLWHGADLFLAESFASERADRDLLGRALIFRLVAEQLAEAPRHDAMLEPYWRVLAAVA